MASGGLATRSALSLSSWFCVPEQGMQNIEILSRASAFLVRRRTAKHPLPYHLLTASHVVAPWRWPRLYPHDWLKCVNSNHTVYTSELRYDNGAMIMQLLANRRLYIHPSRDLAVLSLAENDEGIQLATAAGLQILRLNEKPFANKEEELVFHGHNVTAEGEEQQATSEEDNRLPIPTTLTGKFQGQKNGQAFIKTPTLLTDGMCGGPLVDSKGTCVGLLEGIVSPNSEHVPLRGLGVVVSSQEIIDFLTKIERGEAEQHVQVPDPDEDALKTLFKGDTQEALERDMAEFMKRVQDADRHQSEK